MNRNIIIIIFIFLTNISCNETNTNNTQTLKKTNNSKSIKENSEQNKQENDREFKNNGISNNETSKETKVKEQKDTIPIIYPDELLFPKIIYSLKNTIIRSYGEKAYWFTNKSNDKIIIFSFETDYHKVLQALFDKKNINEIFFKFIQLEKEKDSIIDIYTNNTDKFLTKDTIRNFFKMSPKENVNFFKNIKPKKSNILSDKFYTTKQNFKIGTNIQKALKYYGEPDSIINKNKIKILYWKFLPYQNDKIEKINNQKIILKNNSDDEYYIQKYNDKNSIYYHKPLMIGEVNYPEIYMFFKNDKLIGLIILDGVA